MTALVWGVKASLLTYLADLGDATTTCSDGVRALADGRFRWPADSTETGYRGSGSLRFEAYGGMLDIRIEAPTVMIDEDVVRLLVARRDGPVEIARGAGPLADSRVALTVTAAGARLLGDVYAPGTPLDDLWIEA